MAALGFDDALTALMGLLDREVQLSVSAIPRDGDYQPFTADDAPVIAEGALTAGWDPGAMEASGLGDLVIFRLEGANVRMVLSRTAFDDAQSLEDGTVRIRTAGLEILVGPVGRPEHAELLEAAE